MWLLLIIAVLIGVGMWLYLKPVWAPKPNEVSDALGKNMRGATHQAGRMYKGVRGRMKLRRDKQGLATKFKQWAAGPALEQTQLYNDLPGAAKNFNAWLSTLSPQDTEEFCDKIAHYCAALGFDLAWLVDDQLNALPQLKNAVQEAVTLYSITTWRAMQVETQVQTFKAYQQWLAHPDKHRQVGQKLYGELARQGIITPPPELYLATEKERDAEAVRAIKQVAAEKPDMFTNVLLGLKQPPQIAAPAAPAAPAPAASPAPAAAPSGT